MPELQSLYNNRVNRKIREVIENGEETIFVYEPSVDNVEAIIELQDIITESGLESQTEVVITGNDMVRRVFPMLTNITGIDGLSDEEIENIISNPTIALLQVQHVIETIITQIYKTVILSARKDILGADFDAASLSALDGVLGHLAGLEAQNEETAERVSTNFKKTTDNLVSLVDKQKAKELAKLEEVEEETGEETTTTTSEDEVETETETNKTFNQESPIDEYTNKLEQYLESFSKSSEE